MMQLFVVRSLLLASLLCAGGLAWARGVSWLPSGPPAITGVTLSPGYFTGSPTAGTTIGAIQVVTSGATFTGTETLGGSDASQFAIVGGNLQAAATLSSGRDYDLTLTPTQAGLYNSGIPVPIHPYGGATYYMSPTGSDSNNGTSSGTPWATTAHNIHCADTILAAAGEYAPQSFGFFTWGTVSCPANDNVAWVKCATAFTCDVNGDYLNKGAINIDVSYWGVQGFTATDQVNQNGACFSIQPRTNVTIHHVVFANDVANICPLGGFGSSEYGGATGPGSVDYTMFIGDLVWNGAHSPLFCGSAMAQNSLTASDLAPGPHILWAQNVVVTTWSGVNCAGNGQGGGETDGQGYMLDDLFQHNYLGLVVLENNLAVGNGGAGWHINSFTVTRVRNNTFVGDIQDPNNCPNTIGEMWTNAGIATVTNNIAVSYIYRRCSALQAFAQDIEGMSSGTIIDLNWLWNTADNTQIAVTWNSGFGCANGSQVPNPGQNSYNSLHCPGDVVGDPLLVGPTAPPNSEWVCSGISDTWTCTAAFRARFVPTASGSSGFGFMVPVAADQYNSTQFFKNVYHALPAALNPHGF